MTFARDLPVRWPSGRSVEALVALGHVGRRQLVTAELRGYGIAVQVVRAGREVIAQLRSREGCADDLPLVFADMALPDPDGLSVLAALRFSGLYGPYVLVVRDVDADVRQTVRNLGAVAVDEQTIELDDIAAAMTSAWYQARDSLRPAAEESTLPERRRFQRRSVELWIEQCDPSSATTHHNRSANLSLGGLSLRLGVPETEGRMFYLSFSLPGERSPVEVTSRIVSVRAEGQEFVVGMQFLDLSHDARRCIARFVDSSAPV